MDELFGWFIGLLAIMTIVVYVCWIVIATLLRVFAWVVFYWMITFSLGLAGGLVTGLIVPFRVLSGRSDTAPEIASPDEVTQGHVMKHPPRGFTKYFGWDRAWPVYNPYQSERDAVAVRDDVKAVLVAAWGKASGKVRRPSIDASGSGPKKVGNISLSVVKTIPGVIWGIFVPVPFIGFFLGAWASFVMWYLLMLILGGIIYLAQQVWVLSYRWLDKAKLLRARASVMCHKCYATSPYPSYRCINPACGIIHRDVSPGPLGVLHRRCECGESFPTTIGAASKVLLPVCPICGEQLAEGSGARQTIQLPAFGAVGAGKTRLFAAALTAAEKQLLDANGTLEPLGPDAAGFLKASTRALNRGAATDKTIPTMRPAGQPMKLGDAAGHVVELQLMDAAGESFTNWHTTEELTYVNYAPTMIFVLDPLAFPRINSELTSCRSLSDVFVASGDQEDAFASVADRLRSEDVKLSNRHLAVVITKTDILRLLPSGQALDPTSSDSVRDWLIRQNQDGFVRRLESDFGEVRFFAVDSLRPKDVHDPLNPLHVFQWALETQKVAITLVPELSPEAAISPLNHRM